jgi:hypothetical protein
MPFDEIFTKDGFEDFDPSRLWLRWEMTFYPSAAIIIG